MGCGNVKPNSQPSHRSENKAMAKTKLYYFNGRGIGETIRLVFVQAGEPFDDIRIEQSDWPAHKPNMPLGQMPVLEIDGVKIPQSLPIARYLARKFHLAGKDELEQLKVDVCVHTIADYRQRYIQHILAQPDPELKAEGRKTMVNEELPKFLPFIDKLLSMWSPEGPFFLGSEITWADLICFDFMQSMFELDPTIGERFPRIEQHYNAVKKQPRIAAYLKVRPKTDF
ncbi:unnamed protein product [Rotaria sp. Silwood1]|nr:unnamed protein product [Rotaria sp. Silwood1]CAF5017575.1 unnamed protein product [Rotaria sp. Silwood1]